MKNLIYLSLLTTAFFLSCGDDETPDTLDYASLCAITGMDFFDINGSAIGRWNTPNTNDGAVRVFPNPSAGLVTILSQSNVLERLWLIPAECVFDTTTSNITELSLDLAYDIPDLEEKQVIDNSMLPNDTQFLVDLSPAGRGMYRLFYQFESGDIHWTNVFIDPGVVTFPDNSFIDEFCN